MSNKKEPLVAMNKKMFKNIIKTDAGMEILKEIISNTINEKVDKIELLNLELEGPNAYIKGKVIDVYVESASKKILVEVMSDNDHDEAVIRVMEFLANKYDNDVKVGEKHEKIDEYININFSYASVNEKLESKYQISNEDGTHLWYENYTLYEYDITKIHEKIFEKDISDKLKYLAVMMCNDAELDKLGESNEKIKMFKEELDKIKSDEYYNNWLEQEEDDEMWHNIKVYEAKKESISERNIEIAKNMLEMNLDIETISKATGLSIEEIENLK